MAEITLLDLFLAVEHGPMFKTQMESAVENPRIDRARAAVTNHLQEAENAMKGLLGKTTLLGVYRTMQGDRFLCP